MDLRRPNYRTFGDVAGAALAQHRARRAGLVRVPTTKGHTWAAGAALMHDTGDLHKMLDFSAPVSKEDGKLVSNDKTMNAMLALLNKDDHFQAAVRDMDLHPEETLHFSFPASTLETCYQLLLAEYPAPDVVELRAPTKTDPHATRFADPGEMLPALVFMLIELRNRGKRAFKEDARVKNNVLEPVHPYDLLAQMKYQVRAGHDESLANLVQQNLASGKEELIARQVSCQYLAQLAKTDFAPLELLASVCLTVVGAYALEKMAVGALSKLIFARELKESGLAEITREVYARAPAYKQFLEVLNKAWPSVLLESADLVIVKSALRKLAKEPVTMEYIRSEIPDALLGGVAAFALSLPDKAEPFIRLRSEAAADVIGPLIGSPLASIGGAFGVMKTLYKQWQKSPAQLLAMYGSEGTLALPSDVHSAADLRRYMTDRTKEGLCAGGATAISRSSLVAAAMFGLLLNAGTRLVPETAREIIKFAVNQPIELWTLNFCVLVERTLGGDRVLHRELQAVAEQARDGKIDPVKVRSDLGAQLGGQLGNAMYAVWAWMWFSVLTVLTTRTPAAPSNRVPYDRFKLPAASDSVENASLQREAEGTALGSPDNETRRSTDALLPQGWQADADVV